MAGDLVVRDIDPGDLAAWTPLWRGYNAFYGREGASALPEEITLETWRRFFDPDMPVHALVADLDGEIVGLTHYLFHLSTTQSAPICYLQDLFTTQATRGRGVGRALIEAVYTRARAAGSHHVYWQTHQTNTVAQALYDKISAKSGFIVYRTDVWRG